MQVRRASRVSVVARVRQVSKVASFQQCLQDVGDSLGMPHLKGTMCTLAGARLICCLQNGVSRLRTIYIQAGLIAHDADIFIYRLCRAPCTASALNHTRRSQKAVGKAATRFSENRTQTCAGIQGSAKHVGPHSSLPCTSTDQSRLTLSMHLPAKT